MRLHRGVPQFIVCTILANRECLLIYQLRNKLKNISNPLHPCCLCYLLNRTSTRTLEFDFEKDRYDIRIPSDIYEATTDAAPKAKSYIPVTSYSLRVRNKNIHVTPPWFYQLLIIVFSMGVGILQCFVPEATDAGDHTWSKSENTAHS